MSKLAGIRCQLEDLNIDGFLVTTEENIRYLTGFTGSLGAVLLTKSQGTFLSDFRYEKQASEEVVGYDVTIFKQPLTLIEAIVKQVNKMNIKKIGFESSYLSHEAFSQLEERLSIELIPTTQVVEKLRAIKSEEEIAKLRTAAAIGDKAFEHILNFIRPGVTEIDIANELEYQMRKEGATVNSSNSSNIMVSSGARTSFPHGTASSKVVEKGDLVMLDFGALYQGYRSDMTRTIAVGEIDSKFQEIYSIVLEALLLCTKQLESEMFANQVDAIPRDYITNRGYGDYFGHGTGHGLGLMIREDPILSPTSKQILKAGMVTTVEPGIYIPDLGGVRIEDNVVVKKQGNEILTKSTKKLIIL